MFQKVCRHSYGVRASMNKLNTVFNLVLYNDQIFVSVPFDPGWNDPPTLSYNMQQSTPNRPRNYLNKRVAFPLSGTSPNPGCLPHMNLPKMPSMPPIPSPSVPKPNSCEDIELDDEGTLTEVKSILLKFLEDSPELGPKANDIRKRISVMEEMWSNNKLNKMVHVQMKQLAEGKLTLCNFCEECCVTLLTKSLIS